MTFHCTVSHGMVLYLFDIIAVYCMSPHYILFYGMAWYCISFGLIARYHTVMYRFYSAPANYRVVHLVIFLLSQDKTSPVLLLYYYFCHCQCRGHELDLSVTRIGSSSCPLRDIIAEIRWPQSSLTSPALAHVRCSVRL